MNFTYFLQVAFAQKAQKDIDELTVFLRFLDLRL